MGITTRAQLVEVLRERQQREGLSERAFALRLGISAALWNETHRGKQPAGMRLLRGAAQAYPDLKTAALFLLLAEFDISNSNDQNSGTEQTS